MKIGDDNICFVKYWEDSPIPQISSNQIIMKYKALCIEWDADTPENKVDLPEDWDDVGELVYNFSCKGNVLREKFDITARKTRHVYCRYLPPGEIAEEMPITLPEPSQYLETLRLYNLPVTQTLLDTAAACPNLKNLSVLTAWDDNTEFPTVSENLNLTVQRPANSGNMKTWAFCHPSISQLADWHAPELEVLVANRITTRFVPEGLLGKNLSFLAVENSGMTDELAQATMKNVKPFLKKMDLSGNLITELPWLSSGLEKKVCYHIPWASFGSDCACQIYEESFPVHKPEFFDYNDIGTDLMEKDLLGLCPTIEGYMTVCLNDNPICHTHFPELMGQGRYESELGRHELELKKSSVLCYRL